MSIVDISAISVNPSRDDHGSVTYMGCVIIPRPRTSAKKSAAHSLVR